ncbi:MULTISPECIES: hypothetical protein [Burkholderia]|uniref:hypothetical protein n=1 Tax=Burkholderia TaxID=32008 RepID=UPI0012E38E72|nr:MULTISPECIES: hypothetical protein [Burkholderia]
MIIRSSHRLRDIPIRRGSRAGRRTLLSDGPSRAGHASETGARRFNPVDIDTDAKDIRPASLSDSAQATAYMSAPPANNATSRAKDALVRMCGSRGRPASIRLRSVAHKRIRPNGTTRADPCQSMPIRPASLRRRPWLQMVKNCRAWPPVAGTHEHFMESDHATRPIKSNLFRSLFPRAPLSIEIETEIAARMRACRIPPFHSIESTT